MTPKQSQSTPSLSLTAELDEDAVALWTEARRQMRREQSRPDPRLLTGAMTRIVLPPRERIVLLPRESISGSFQRLHAVRGGFAAA